MFIRNLISLSLLLLSGRALALPDSPIDPLHPGSKIYPFQFKQETFKCSGRDMHVFLPSTQAGQKIPAVVYGHGQALGVENYRQTFEHLAGKGIAAIYPTYDTGFFDQNWERMGRDYVTLTECALKKFTNINPDQVIFSGHSKGAYVASMAAGIAARENLSPRPAVLMVFAAAGANSEVLKNIPKETSVSVIYSDADSIVSREISEDIYRAVGSDKKQFIYVRSYPSLKANHFWVLTKRAVFGGGPESSLHYYGSWKWLTAAAFDLQAQERFTQPYIYGDLAADKGIPDLTDEITRNWP